MYGNEQKFCNLIFGNKQSYFNMMLVKKKRQFKQQMSNVCILIKIPNEKNQDG